MFIRLLLFCVVLSLGSLSLADVITYTYDEAGRLTRVDYGGGKTVSYNYDKSGNLLSRVVTSGEQASGQTASKREPATEAPVTASAKQDGKKKEDRRK